MNHHEDPGISACAATPEQQKLIDSKVAHLQTYEKEIPGIIVIHDLQNFNVEYISESGLARMNTTIEKLKSMAFDYYKTLLSEDSYAYDAIHGFNY